MDARSIIDVLGVAQGAPTLLISLISLALGFVALMISRRDSRASRNDTNWWEAYRTYNSPES